MLGLLVSMVDYPEDERGGSKRYGPRPSDLKASVLSLFPERSAWRFARRSWHDGYDMDLVMIAVI